MNPHTQLRNMSALARYHARRTRWLHDWVQPTPRRLTRKPWHERATNWILLLSALYTLAQLIRWYVS